MWEGQILTNTEHMRMMNGIPLEALVTQLLRSPYLLGVVALSEGGEPGAPSHYPPAAGAMPATFQEAGIQNPQVILWQTDKSQAPARWLLMEFADQGRLIVSRPHPSLVVIEAGTDSSSSPTYLLPFTRLMYRTFPPP